MPDGVAEFVCSQVLPHPKDLPDHSSDPSLMLYDEQSGMLSRSDEGQEFRDHRIAVVGNKHTTGPSRYLQDRLVCAKNIDSGLKPADSCDNRMIDVFIR
jgi:hypothetical protein